MNRRQFLISTSGFALAVQPVFGFDPRYKIGYTTNTRGSDPLTTWGADPFRGFREAHDVGFNYVEAFATALHEFYPNDAAGLRKRIDGIGVRFAAITGGARGGSVAFEDPVQRQAVIENHLGVVRFSKKFGCGHQKTNLGRQRPGGTTQEDLKNIAETLQILGRRSLTEEGMPFGVHAHLGSQLQNQNDIDFIMANTDPKNVRFVLDTGHITMAGMDPIALAKRLNHRIVEFHLKDTKAGRSGRYETCSWSGSRPDDGPIFFPAGYGRRRFSGTQGISGRHRLARVPRSRTGHFTLPHAEGERPNHGELHSKQAAHTVVAGAVGDLEPENGIESKRFIRAEKDPR